MIITDNKIVVTHEMMQAENMVRPNQLAIPYRYGKDWKVKWKSLPDMSNKDFEAIEDYFIEIEG